MIGLPEELDKLKTKFSTIPIIKKLFQHDSWIVYDKYNAYDLAEKLDIPTWPNCRRIYKKYGFNKNREKNYLSDLLSKVSFPCWLCLSTI